MEGGGDGLETVFAALDLLSEAKKLTKGINMKIFCKAKFREGKLLYDFISRERAKSCFKEVLDISLTEAYTNTEFYKEANGLFQEIKKSEEVPPSERKMAFLTELEPHIKEIDAAAEKKNAADKCDYEGFINFLFERFPPSQHFPRAKKPEVGKGADKSALKKAYAKLSGYYHPDKVITSRKYKILDVAVQGEKYKVLCEEIAKRVNNKYTELKNMD